MLKVVHYNKIDGGGHIKVVQTMHEIFDDPLSFLEYVGGVKEWEGRTDIDYSIYSKIKEDEHGNKTIDIADIDGRYDGEALITSEKMEILGSHGRRMEVSFSGMGKLSYYGREL